MKNFFKKYKWFILAGVILGLVLVTIFLLVAKHKKEQRASSIVNNKVFVEPFVAQNIYSIKTIPSKQSLFQNEYIPVYRIKASKASIEDLIEKLNPDFTKIAESEYSASWNFGTVLVGYNYDMGILSLTSREKTDLGIKIVDQNAVVDFFRDYFNYQVDEINVSKDSDGNYIYSGKYSVGDFRFGSLEIDSDAYKLLVDSSGNLYQFDILLYDTSSVIQYSAYLPIDSKNLVSTRRILGKYMSINESYYEKNPIQQSSIEIVQDDPKQLVSTYLFKNFSHGYIFPVYIINSDVKVKDFVGNEYLATINYYICAVSEEFLEKSEIENEGDLPVPYLLEEQ